NGISPELAAGLFTLSSAVLVPVSLLAGYLSDRVPMRLIISATLALQALWPAVMINARTPGAAVASGIVWGCVTGFISIVMMAAWPSFFGRRHLGSIRGIASTAGVLAAALGPLLIGVAYDFFGGYAEALYALALLSLAAAAAALAIPSPPALIHDRRARPQPQRVAPPSR
ncbi:MAG: MFS transporter, partial [Thermaerobacterales bacterium]